MNFEQIFDEICNWIWEKCSLSYLFSVNLLYVSFFQDDLEFLYLFAICKIYDFSCDS